MNATLSLHFRLEELSLEGRAFAGEVSSQALAEQVKGLAGPLGYTPQGPARAQGQAYATTDREVIVSGQLEGQFGFECARCLAARTLDFSLAFDHVLMRGAAADPEADLGQEFDEQALDEPEIVPFDGEDIDLDALLREDILLNLPMNPSCELVAHAQCAPLQVEGAVEEDEPKIDPRWAPLLALKDKIN